MRDTFEYSGDHEWAIWRKGVLCAPCGTWDGTETEAVGIRVEVYGKLDADDLGEIHVLPVCEACANDNVIRFVKEDN